MTAFSSFLPVVDLEAAVRVAGIVEPNFDESNALVSLSRMVCDRLENDGAIIVRDPRFGEEDNEEFLNMMERYFEQSQSTKMADARPQLHFQVGVTPEGHEIPRSAIDDTIQLQIREQSESDRAQLPAGPDNKWRYMWRIGERPAVSEYQELNAEPVIPHSFPEWSRVMNNWGSKLMSTVNLVAQLAALGFGLPSHTFTSLMHLGPHLLAPTGSDLSRYSTAGTVLAGYHYDFNFLTIHGRSRFPGLNIWLRNGRRVKVAVPPGCLLLQAGKQLEWLTGARCQAGMHEVIVTEETIKVLGQRREKGLSPWRVSSTLFAHVASDAILEPLPHFRQLPTAHNYPAMTAGAFAELELKAINLASK